MQFGEFGSRSKEIEDVGQGSGLSGGETLRLKRLGELLIRYPRCPPSVENDVNAMAKLTKEKPPFDVMQKGLIDGGNRKRVRRNIAASQAQETNVTAKWANKNNYSTSTSTPQSSTPTLPPLPYPQPPPLPSPLNEQNFLNITMHCENYWFSCRGRCTQERELGGTEERLQCFCDNSCEFFKDCCADFDQYCSSSGVSTQEKQIPDNGLWECVENHFLADVIGVWMLSSCPRNWTQTDIEERCNESASLSYETHKDNLPVIDRNGFTYKNHYCAQCHGLDLKDLTFYNLKFKCDVPAPKGYKRSETLKFLFTFCYLFFWQPPTGATRRYCHRVASNEYCLDDSLPEIVQQKCVNGSLRIVYEKDTPIPKNFFNPYCARCNGVKNIGCGPGISKYIGDPTHAKPFSLVMDLDFSGHNTDKETSTVREHKVSCRKGDVYDFYLQVCRAGITPSDFVSSHSRIYSVSVWMRSNISTLWIPLVTKLNFKEAIVDKLNLNETLLSNISIENPFGHVSTVVFNINVHPTIQKNFSIQTFQTEMSSLSIVLNNANFTVFKVTVKLFDCSVTEVFSPREYTFERNAVKVRDTGEIFQEADYYTNETEWINGSLVPTGFLTVCKQLQLNCSGVFVGLNKNEYVILANGSLYRNISGESFESGKFQLINENVEIKVGGSKMAALMTSRDAI
ncbi:hypothetical protein ACROYT_G001871 [Oculina patagonica]